ELGVREAPISYHVYSHGGFHRMCYGRVWSPVSRITGTGVPPMPQINTILRLIRRLDATERDELIHRLSALGSEPTIRELREVRFADGLRYPRCQGTEVVRCGKFAQKSIEW